MYDNQPSLQPDRAGPGASGDGGAFAGSTPSRGARFHCGKEGALYCRERQDFGDQENGTTVSAPVNVLTAVVAAKDQPFGRAAPEGDR